MNPPQVDGGLCKRKSAWFLNQIQPLERNQVAFAVVNIEAKQVSVAAGLTGRAAGMTVEALDHSSFTRWGFETWSCLAKTDALSMILQCILPTYIPLFMVIRKQLHLFACWMKNFSKMGLFTDWSSHKACCIAAKC